MKIFDSPIYGRISAPETLQEIINLAINPIDGIYYNVYMWRGQSNIEWPLHSGAYRRLKLTSDVVTEQEVCSYEEALIKRARFNNFDIVEGKEISDFDLLARLQHHGAATRLIDTSRNVLIALYFAANSNIDCYGLVIGFHTYHLGGYEGQGEYRPYNEVIARASVHDHPQTWSPPVVSPRIAAQHSQFVYSRVMDSRIGSLAVVTKDNACLPIAISPALKPEILKYLAEAFDIRQSTLFPDLPGFCEVNSAGNEKNIDSRW